MDNNDLKIEELDNAQGEIDRKIQKILDDQQEQDFKMKGLKTALDQKLELEEGHKIKDNLKRFAEYDDLKELYKKVIPAISSFEQKMMEYKSGYEHTENIILEFEKILLKKANKSYLDEVS